MSHDYSGYSEVLSPDKLAQLTELTKKLTTADRAVAILETQLEEAKARVKVLREQMIPDLMTDAGIKMIQTQDGHTVEVRSEVRASLPKEPEAAEAAFIWLKEAGHDDLVKRTFTISFNKGEEAWADEFEKKLVAEKRPLKIDRKKSIHHQTLCAFIREQLAEGTDVPLPLFGAMIQKFAKVHEK